MTRIELWARPRHERYNLPFVRVGVLTLPQALDAETLRRWNASMEFVYGWTGVEYAIWLGCEVRSRECPD